MTGMLKVKTRWSGFTGSPGWTNFFFRDFSGTGEPTQPQAVAAVGRVNTFFQAIKDKFPASVTLTIQSDVEVIEETDGKMQSVFSVTAPAAIVGSNSIATFSGASGAVVNWRTNGVRNGRRVGGRTFLVPTSTALYQNDGTLDTAHRTGLQTAADALANGTTESPDLGVWARPSSKGATDGVWWAVSAATVPDLAAVLRSRRD